MRVQGFPRISPRLALSHLAPLAALLLAAAASLGAPGASAQMIPIMFQNASGVVITSPQITGSSGESWGPNILSRAVQPGEAFGIEVPMMPSGCTYDLRLISREGQEFDMWDVDLCSSRFISFQTPSQPVVSVPPVSVPQAPSRPASVPQAQSRPAEVQRIFTIRNTNNRWAVVEVNVARAEVRNWGENMLDNIIQPGQMGTASFWTSNVNNCVYVVRVISSDGFEAVDNNANLCQSYTFFFD